MTGRWDQPEIPHKGWVWVDTEDLESERAICEMCCSQEIRYIHVMTHPSYPDLLRVGCICAEKMTDDYVRPRERERDHRNRSSRRKRLLTRKWEKSRRGNDYLDIDGYRIIISPRRNGWGGQIIHINSGKNIHLGICIKTKISPSLLRSIQ